MSWRGRLASWLAVLLGALVAQGCPQSVEQIFECASRDGERIASFYRVFGGGAAGWQLMRVSVRPKAEPFDADDFIFEMSHGYDVRLEWQDSQNLLIGYPGTARIEKTPGAVAEGVDISLRPFDSADGTFVNPEEAGCIGPTANYGR